MKQPISSWPAGPSVLAPVAWPPLRSAAPSPFEQLPLVSALFRSLPISATSHWSRGPWTVMLASALMKAFW